MIYEEEPNCNHKRYLAEGFYVEVMTDNEAITVVLTLSVYNVEDDGDEYSNETIHIGIPEEGLAELINGLIDSFTEAKAKLN